MQGLVWGLLLALCGSHKVLATTESSEHKVPYIQNIVLYPDKHSWCKTTEIKQIVAYPECTSIEIDNNVCVGACFSYSIPKTSPSAPGEVITPYCDSCQPAKYTWREVKLKCKNESEELTKKVQIIENCVCTSCQSQQNQPRNPESDFMKLMLHNQGLSEKRNEQTDQLSVNNIQRQTVPQELENIIDVDEEKEKETSKELDEGVEEEEEENLELLHVNKDRSHLIPGPHHSLVIKPDNVLVGHAQEKVILHVRHEPADSEEIPSLLPNQFKIHDDSEFPDQLAVESRKEFEGKQVKIISVPHLIYKSWNNSQFNDEDEDNQDEVEEELVATTIPSHHSQHRHHQQHQVNQEKEISMTPHHHRGHHHLLQSEDDMKHKIVKVVEVSHHHLKPAEEGAQLSYVVKDEEGKND